MKLIKVTALLLLTALSTSCASSYKPIKPENLKFSSRDITDNVTMEFKYDLLKKKYERKQKKKNIKVVAVKITNNSDRDLMFGRDLTLAYSNGNQANIVESDIVFSELKQKGAYHLFYLLFTPMNLYTDNGRGKTSSTPIGLAVGPGLAATNMIVAGSANKKFQKDLMEYDLNGVVINKGETKFGLIGLYQGGFEFLKLKIK